MKKKQVLHPIRIFQTNKTNMNVILTRVNTFTPSFSEEISLKNEPDGDMIFLEKFVRNMHKNADISTQNAAIEVYTSKGAYCYTVKRTHIKRITINSNTLRQTPSRKYWRIS